MPDDGLHQPFAQRAVAMRLEHEDVADPSKRRVIGDHSRESYLLTPFINAETERVLDRVRHGLDRTSTRPIGAIGQEIENNLEIQTLPIRADHELSTLLF